MSLYRILNAKDVLLLCPKFYGYDLEIKSKLEQNGAIVTYENSDTSREILDKVKISRIRGKDATPYIRKFENQLYDSICSKKYDYVIIICGWAITSYLTSKIRSNLLAPGGRMVLYYWDSITRLHDDRKRWNDFDQVFSFDDKDCNDYANQVKHLPLFYCDKYWNKEESIREYDLATVGTFMYNRYSVLKKIKDNNPSITIRYHLVAPSKIRLYWHKYIKRDCPDIKIDDITTKKMSNEDIVDFYKKANAILDVKAEGQDGLTIRTFETLAMHRKIVTTNPYIKNYIFYDEDNIYVVEDEMCKLPGEDWFRKPFSIDDDLIKQYSIDSWIYKLLSI